MRAGDQIVWGRNVVIRISRVKNLISEAKPLEEKSEESLQILHHWLGDKDLHTSAEQPEEVQRWMKGSGEMVLWRWKSDSFKKREKWWRINFYFRNVCCIFSCFRERCDHTDTVMRTCGPHKTRIGLCGGCLLGWSCFLSIFAVKVWALVLAECIYTHTHCCAFSLVCWSAVIVIAAHTHTWGNRWSM